MSPLHTTINASDTTLSQLLKDKKYTVDYFQREYRWQDKHMVQLVSDLTSAFLQDYEKGDDPSEVANYNTVLV